MTFTQWFLAGLGFGCGLTLGVLCFVFTMAVVVVAIRDIGRGDKDEK